MSGHRRAHEHDTHARCLKGSDCGFVALLHVIKVEGQPFAQMLSANTEDPRLPASHWREIRAYRRIVP